VPDFLAASAHVQRAAEPAGELAHLVVVVAFVQAEVLRPPRSRCRPRHEDAYWQQRLDPLPQGVRDPPAVVLADQAHPNHLFDRSGK